MPKKNWLTVSPTFNCSHIVDSDLEPIDILYYYDTPQIFTYVSKHGHLLLFYCVGRETNFEVFLTVRTSIDLIKKLIDGKVDLLTVLRGDDPMLIFQYNSGIVKASKVSISQIIDRLPKSGVRLMPEQAYSDKENV